MSLLSIEIPCDQKHPKTNIVFLQWTLVALYFQSNIIHASQHLYHFFDLYQRSVNYALWVKSDLLEDALQFKTVFQGIFKWLKQKPKEK